MALLGTGHILIYSWVEKKKKVHKHVVTWEKATLFTIVIAPQLVTASLNTSTLFTIVIAPQLLTASLNKTTLFTIVVAPQLVTASLNKATLFTIVVTPQLVTASLNNNYHHCSRCYQQLECCLRFRETERDGYEHCEET
jgi:hypothetical protein